MCDVDMWQCGIVAVCCEWASIAAGAASGAGAFAVIAPSAMPAIFMSAAFMPAEAQQGIAAELSGT